MHHAVLMGAVHGVAQIGQQPQALPLGRICRAPPLRERDPLDVLHREIRPGPVRGLDRAGVEQPRDAGVVQPAQRLDLAFEATEEEVRHRAGAQDLQRDGWRRRRRRRYFDQEPGEVDDPHAPLAEQPQHAIGPENLGNLRGRLPPGRCIEQPARLVMVGQQIDDLPAQLPVAPARHVEKAVPPLARQGDGLEKESLPACVQFVVDERTPRGTAGKPGFKAGGVGVVKGNGSATRRLRRSRLTTLPGRARPAAVGIFAQAEKSPENPAGFPPTLRLLP